MTEKYISSLHIQKLGHEILEIRERALSNITSKLDHGFVYDNDLARSKEILSRLLEWFLHEPCTKQDLVFGLIKRILKSQSGKALINHYGTATFREEIKRIRSYISPQFYKNLEEVLFLLDQFQANNIVPPLETDVPLSYRTGQSSPSPSREVVGSTATTIEGYVQQDASATQQAGFEPKSQRPNSASFVISPLKWQFLIEPDRHVLQSIESSVRRPPEPSSLLHSAEFFSNVLLQDFPAEIFLQRPYITLTFLDLVVKCPSTRIVNSILNGLLNLTRALQVRVNLHKDPAMFNSKDTVGSQVNSRASTPDSTSRRTASGQSDEETEVENAEDIKKFQISFPRYCYSCFKTIFKFLCFKNERKKKTNRKGTNLAFSLLEELVNLLLLVLDANIWNEGGTPRMAEVRKQLNEILIGYGVVLEHFRLEANCDDSDLNSRVFHLCILQNCANFLTRTIPLSQTGLLLPRNLKNALTNSLVDVTLSKLYPKLHETLLDYVQSFSLGNETESLRKYHETSKICKSMSSAVEFLESVKFCEPQTALALIQKAMPCLEFHKDVNFVREVVNLASENSQLEFDEVILKLLAHNSEEIQEEAYRVCQKKIVASIGPRLNTSCFGAPGSQIVFLAKPQILVELASHGLLHENPTIQNLADDILLHLLKCKILVSEAIWNRIVEALITSLPILLCHANKTTSLGRTLLNLVDPDTAKSVLIPKIEVVRSNVLLLFSKQNELREEAFSRLCWMLSSQRNSREMLPRCLNNLHDKALPNVAFSHRVIDVNRTRNTQHFYQPSSLQQVLELLNSRNVEPVIRRSALTQISVMMEDSLLHSSFIERNGVETVLEVMQKALVEKEFENYPDSVIPAVGILKSICLFHSGVRQELSANAEVYLCVLRGLFLFFTEEKLKQDAVTLLFLLIFNGFVKGTPSKGDVSLPRLVKERLRAPFSCNTHWETSPHCEEKLLDLIKADRWCLSSVQIQWNLLAFRGFENLLTWNDVNYENRNVVECLRMSTYDLGCLKASAVGFCVRKFLVEVQNSVNHENVIEAVNKLITYLHLYKIAGLTDENILNHQWEVTFGRFLKSLPSGEDDAKLLSCVLNFLKLLVPFYRNSDEPVWLIEFLKSPANLLIDLITLENDSSDEFKALSKDILSLITVCAINEQHFLDYSFSSPKQKKNSTTWCNIIENIANNLKFSDSTHFYNLAYLDSLLSCLVHLTASLGWSKSGIHQKKLLSQLVASLCELVVVFHCGKGPTAAISVMGLSITRHVILVLNHLIAEMHYTKMKNWEDCFLDFDEDDWLKSFMILWSSRDAVLRAGALQLFAGLSQSPRLAINIVNELKNEKQEIWSAALALLTDQDEASVVRENSAMLLVNMTAHSVDNLNGDKVIIASLMPKNGKEDCVTAIFNLFDEFQFYKCAVNVLTALYTNRLLDFDSNLFFSEQNGDDTDQDQEDESGRISNGSSLISSITTPALVKSLASLLLNLHNLDSDRLSYKMQDSGLTKLIFRCVCNPNMNISDTRKLSLYCEILEMNISIFSLLTQLIRTSAICLGTVLHTKDCINATVSLLNKKNYHTHLPQLLYLRNRLWSEIFKLLANLIDHNQIESNKHQAREALAILSEAINDSGGRDFTGVLCEALSSLTSDELQNSALVSLTSLLTTEARFDSSLRSSKTNSLQSLLDTARSGEQSEIAGGGEICKILLNLYDLSSMNLCSEASKKRSLISATLSSILAVSQEAQSFATDCGLVNLILKQFKEIIAKLSLENVDSLRRATDKKRLIPVLRNLNDVVGLATNFLAGSEQVKKQFAERGLCDFLHKLWAWFLAQKNNLLLDVLQLLATFSVDSPPACRAMTLTSSVAGSGPRKTPTKESLLHAVIAQIEKEMELTSKTHNLRILELCFAILSNACSAIECRVLMVKSGGVLFGSIGRLHPAVTKRQKVWESVEMVWLEFFQNFSLYAEGQSALAKIGDVFELIVSLASSGGKASSRLLAMLVLRNVAFYHPNRARLLTSDEFLGVLQSKLESGSNEERDCCVLMMWSLGANNQKAKIVFKACQLDVKLEHILRRYQLGEEFVDAGEIERAEYVLRMIRDGDKSVR